MTGNPNLTQLHLDTALAQCQTYILLNSTLEREQPDVTKVSIYVLTTVATKVYVHQVSKSERQIDACFLIEQYLNRVF